MASDATLNRQTSSGESITASGVTDSGVTGGGGASSSGGSAETSSGGGTITGSADNCMLAPECQVGAVEDGALKVIDGSIARYFGSQYVPSSQAGQA